MRPSLRRRFHATVFGVMLVILPPTLTWWKDSLVYIAFMSWTAMAYAALIAWQQSLGEQRQDPAEPNP